MTTRTWPYQTNKALHLNFQLHNILFKKYKLFLPMKSRKYPRKTFLMRYMSVFLARGSSDAKKLF